MANHRINFQARVEPWVKAWWDATALREGFNYKGSDRPHLKGMLTAIASGEYELKKVQKPIDTP